MVDSLKDQDVEPLFTLKALNLVCQFARLN